MGWDRVKVKVFHLPPALVKRRLDTMQQLLIGQSLIDDVAHALRARLRCERDAALAQAAAHDVGDVLVEPVHALRRVRA